MPACRQYPGPPDSSPQDCWAGFFDWQSSLIQAGCFDSGGHRRLEWCGRLWLNEFKDDVQGNLFRTHFDAATIIDAIDTDAIDSNSLCGTAEAKWLAIT